MIKAKILFGLFLFALLSSCTEPYALQAKDFQEILIIEGTITNELKNQEIKISKTIPIDDQQQNIVENANVQVMDDSGTTYPFSFQETSYKSNNAFQAIAGKTYKLLVQLNGQSYESNLQTVPDAVSIQTITANVTTKNNGNRGVSIAVNTDNSGGNTKNYRYAYEETYIVKPPKWVNQDLIFDNFSNNFQLVPRPLNTKFGYASNNSAEIINTTTNGLAENKVSNYEVLFLRDNNYIISYRYSVLVKQFLQNDDAYTYYNQTKLLQNSGQTLSPSQPGFITGNIVNLTNSNEKVIGFFEVATVSEKRIFFNYSDLFPGEEIPTFFLDCEPQVFDLTQVSDPPVKELLKIRLEKKNVVYLDGSGSPSYFMVAPSCGDASYFSSLIKPSFWID